MTPASSHSLRPSAPLLLRALAWLAASAVLLGVFMLYTEPDFLVTLADRVWSCF